MIVDNFISAEAFKTRVKLFGVFIHLKNNLRRTGELIAQVDVRHKSGTTANAERSSRAWTNCITVSPRF